MDGERGHGLDAAGVRESGFDYRGRLVRLRCRSTEELRAHRRELVRAQRELRLEELATVAVLDERGQVDDALAAEDGVSVRSARETIETARALEALPAVAAAAHAGALSGEQLAPLARLADPASDGEWAARAPGVAPADLERLARTRSVPSVEEAQARRAARSLGMWWRRGEGMLEGRFRLPDLDGAFVESVLNSMIDGMHPPRGEAWATRAQRGADALGELCRFYRAHQHLADDADVLTRLAPRAHLVVEVPLEGPAEVAGIPLPASMVEALRADAHVEAVLVDDLGVPVTTGTSRATLSPKVVRAVLLRDGHCRWPGCTRRTGLQVHHLWPRSWGGTDQIANLAAVCVGGGTDHHPRLAPHGPWLLLGNPNRPDGLRLVPRDQVDPRAGPDQPIGAEPRAGPNAA